MGTLDERKLHVETLSLHGGQEPDPAVDRYFIGSETKEKIIIFNK